MAEERNLGIMQRKSKDKSLREEKEQKFVGGWEGQRQGAARERNTRGQILEIVGEMRKLERRVSETTGGGGIR